MQQPHDERDWSIGIGLRNALLNLLAWGVILALAWALLLIVLAPLINKIPLSGRGILFVYALIAIVPGWALGHVLYDRMTERAGFNSLVLTGVALMAVWAASIAGGLLADGVRTLDAHREWLLIISAGFIATIYVIYETLADR
jgi:hypothetical protein